MRGIKNIGATMPQTEKPEHLPLPTETRKLLQKIFSAKNHGQLSELKNFKKPCLN